MNSPAVNELQLESSVYALLAEFLSGLFDGGAHAVGANAPVSFPKLYQKDGNGKEILNNLRFGQSAVPQPLDGVSITTVFMQGAVQKKWETVNVNSVPTRQQMAYMRARFNFWIRGESKDTASGNAKKQAMTTADLLHAVLDNAGAVRPLMQRGIHRLRPNAVEPVAETAFTLLMIPCAATLRYAILSQA